MLGFSLRDAVDKVAAKFFKTAFGRMLGVTTYQKEQSHFESVSWAAQVTETAIVKPDADGSIELTDLIISTEKKASGTLQLLFTDDTNDEVIVRTVVTDAPCNLALDLVGKVQGWQGAELRYIVGGAAYEGAITVVYVKHNKANSLPYGEWNARR